MRWSDFLVENPADVNVDALVKAIAANDDILSGTWMGRAYDDISSLRFRRTLKIEMENVRQALIPLANGPIAIMRGLYKPYNPEWPLGIHWTTERFVATDYGQYILHAIVKPSNVNWAATIARRIGWPSEREITLKSNVSVHVTEITKGDEIIAVDYIGTT